MKSKKHKKDKKKKHKREKHLAQKGDESSESSGAEAEWVEAPSTAAKQDSPVHDLMRELYASKQCVGQQGEEGDWLESPFLTAATSLSDIRRQRDAKREEEKEKDKSLSSFDNPGQSARELNPFWKDGGTGLPEERGSLQGRPDPVVRKVGPGVDGGVTWLKKSYQRAVEQARDSGRSLEDVIAERWGSREEYERLLAEAEAVTRGGVGSQSRMRGPRGPTGPPPPGWKKGRKEDDSREHGYNEKEERKSRTYDRDSDRRPSEHTRVSRKDRRWNDKDHRYDSREKRSYDSREISQRGFMKPEDRDRDMSSRFKRPEDGDRHESRRSRPETSTRDEQRRDEFPSWRKSGFKKPGDDDSSSSRSFSYQSRGGQSSSSGSSGGWRKTGFKKPGDDEGRTSSRERSSTAHTASTSSSMGRWKKSAPDRPEADTDSDEEMSVSQEESLQRSRGRDAERDDSRSNSDTVRASSSMSQDSKRAGKGAEMETQRSPSPVKLLSDTEMNQLGAKIVKAEIMGNETLVQKLKSQMESARQARISHKTKLLEAKDAGSAQKRSQDSRKAEEEEVILTRTDRSGQSWPLAEQTAIPDSGNKRRKKNIVTHDKDGERERYFADDDDVDLETMVRKERMGSADDHNRLLNKVASKKLMMLDSEFNTLDEMFVSSAAKGESRSRTEERERSKAIAEHQRTVSALSKCPFCLESPEMKKHLIVALGLKAYLCVPQSRCMSEGQCYIVPMQHTVASTAVDEDVWAEIQIFRKGLTKMFEDHDMDAIFLETCMNPKKQRHMCIECIAVPRELGEMGPIYFKKAIMESESEWSQNKKLVDTRKKGIRSSIPRGFPYFSVDFGLDGGFAHVIEDEQTFPHYFGKEVIGGLLDVEPRLWRHPPKENFEDQTKRVLQLTQWWKPFDWTQKIDREKS
ncbi:CWF19-like protein 2 [Diadema setosum]|uniref:CWF19-like protein 2 n=1 Tax=Diadema setosum TaxID=31175 RepID=UPI003B3B5BED